MSEYYQKQNNHSATLKIQNIKAQNYSNLINNKINNPVTLQEFLILKLWLANVFMGLFTIQPKINVFVLLKNLYGQEIIVFNAPLKYHLPMVK